VTTTGRIVVLNGAPRAGKSSIAAAIQEAFAGVWINLGVDVARQMTPPRCQPGIGLRPGEPDHPAARYVPLLYAALYESIAAHSRLGLDVVADVGHHDGTILADCARRLDGLPALFVGVRGPLDVIVDRRLASAPGSYATLGSDGSIPEPVLRWQSEVHRPGVYDLEVDTSVLDAEQCADAIRSRLGSGAAPPMAFRELAGRRETA
jgi:chloramphenicol 3-O phosphotransferase